MTGKSVLLVDDEKTILDCLARDLAVAGFKVTTAGSGEEAVAKINKSFFNLVTTDLLMPGGHGFQVIKETKQLSPQTMVIVLSGDMSATSAVNAFRQGADDYLQKPCDTDELLCRISNCLEKQELMKKKAVYEKLLPVCSHCEVFRKICREDFCKRP